MIDQTAQRTMQVPGQGLIPRGRPAIDYKEYPKMMTHPQYQPGKPSAEIKSPHGFTYHGIGTPVRFPPVLVKTPDDEAYHASLGYESQGKTDPAAFDRAVGNGQIPDQTAYVAIEYPKWREGKLFQSREEEDKAFPPETVLVTRKDSVEPFVDPALNTSITPYVEGSFTERPNRTMEQLRIEDLEAKVDRLTELLAQSLKAQNPPLEVGTTDIIRAGYDRVMADIRDDPAPKKATPKKTAARKMPVLTLDQKQRRSDAIKAGMARKRALTESVPAEQP